MNIIGIIGPKLVTLLAVLIPSIDKGKDRTCIDLGYHACN